jgi:hypothetical protein
MPVEFVRDTINYEKLIGEGSSQTMVNGDIVLGERSPEFGRVLAMDGKTIIVSTETIEEKVVVEGKMLFDILYSSIDEDGNIYKVTANSPFTHTLQVPGTQGSMSCKIKTGIEHMEHELVNNKKIKVNAVIDIKGMVYKKESVETITDIEGEDIQLLKETHGIEEFMAENSDEITVKSSIMVGEQSGEAKSILRDRVFIHKKDIGVQEGRLIINGAALVSLLYEATGEKGVGEAWEDVFFTHEMNIPDVKPGMRCDVEFSIGDINEEIMDDDAGERKTINVELSIGISVKVYSRREFQTIVDAYSSMQRYDFSTDNVKVISFFGEGMDSQSIKEKIMVPSDVGGINVIKNISATPMITDIKMFEDKIAVEGIVQCCMIYSETSEDPYMGSYTEDIPFKSSIDVPDVRIDMLTEAEAGVEELSYEKLSEKEVELRMLLQVSAKAYSRESADIITDVEENELPDSIINMPTLVVCVVQPKDTLWKIAKKYATTVEDIVKINDIQDPDNIQPGTKLIIPRKAFMK